MTTQETAHAIALVVGLPMLAVMMLERAQRHAEQWRPKSNKPKRTHGPREQYKIARPTSARATTNNNRKDSK